MVLGGYTNGGGQETMLAGSYVGSRNAGSMNPSFQPAYGGVGASSLAGYGQGSVGGGAGEGGNWVSVAGVSTYVHGNADGFHQQEVAIKRLQEDLKNAHNEQV